MKRFTKIMLGFAAFFSVVGVVSMIAAFVLGFNWNQLVEMAENGDLLIQKEDNSGKFPFFNHENSHDYEKCENLDIEFLAGSLNILYDDVEKIKVDQEGIRDFSAKMEGHTLKIRVRKNWISSGAKGYLTIIIPEDYVFEKVDLEIGAGQAEIDDLRAKSLEIEVGAGQAEIMNLDVKHFSASAGAGQIEAELVGSEQDYNYDVECGIGEIVIGESSFAGLGRDARVDNPGADRKLDVECGVGQISIEFQK